MAKSIKDVGDKIEKAVEKEVVKKEGEILKDIVKTLPSDVRVRVMKLEDGTRVYVSTVGIEEYDKTDPYAWLKRRFAKKHGSGEYVIEFISPDGEIIKTSTPIYIEVHDTKTKGNEDFLRKAEEALKLKEEAIEKKAEISEKLGQLESEKATMLMELVNKQLDTMTKLYEERINTVKEKLESGGGQDTQFLLLELQRIKDEYRMAVDRIYESIRQVSEAKQPEYMTFFMDILTKSMEKNSITETLQMLNMFKEVFKTDEKKKDFWEEILENPQKAEVFKKILGLEGKKDFITELMENPQKLEIVKKIFGLDEVHEMRASMTELIHHAFAREERPKDVVSELVEYGEKLKKIKDILAPVLGTQSQPAKSFLELLSTIINSPTMPEIVSRIMEGFTKAKLIEQGFIPAELAGTVVDRQALSGAPVQALPPSQAQAHEQAQAQSKKKRKKSAKEDIQMLKNAVAKAIQIAAQDSHEQDTPEQFANRIAMTLFNMGKENPTLATMALITPKKKREAIARETMKELIPDMPDEMLDIIITETENKIKELVESEL